MEITVETVGEIQIVSLGGRFDNAAAPSFDAGIIAVIPAGITRVVLDASALSYLSSAGLRSLLTLQKKMQASGGTLILAGVLPFVQDILNIAGFSKLLRFAPTRESALDALN